MPASTRSRRRTGRRPSLDKGSMNRYFLLQPVWDTRVEKQLCKMAEGGYELAGIQALAWLSLLSFRQCTPHRQRYFVYTVCDTQNRRHLRAYEGVKDAVLPYCSALYCDGYSFIGKLTEDVPDNLLYTIKAEQRKFLYWYHLCFLLVLILLPLFFMFLLKQLGMPYDSGGIVLAVMIGILALYHTVCILLCWLMRRT